MLIHHAVNGNKCIKHILQVNDNYNINQTVYGQQIH